MDEYYERKKRQGFFLTKKNLNPSADYSAMDGELKKFVVTEPGVSYWSRASGRYRTYEEQEEYIKSGMKDVKLPPIQL